MRKFSMNRIHAIAMMEFSAPVTSGLYAVQIPPPNCKNDNAAQRQRAAKKRRKARGRK
jgi:hypothetical protein